MEYFTQGRDVHPGYRLQLRCLSNGDWLEDSDLDGCYRLIFFDKEGGRAQLNGSTCVFSAPCIFCLNEKDRISFSRPMSRVRIICFLPGIINSKFTYENVDSFTSPLKLQDYDDTYWLRPFTVRTPDYYGLLPVGPAIFKRVAGIYDLVQNELTTQADMDWPCRSRSYFFELLAVLQRSSSQAAQIGSLLASDRYPEIAEVILFLHTNYMNKITVTGLSAKYGINRTTLEKQFQEVTGLSIIEYLIRLRLELAALFLRDTLLPVGEIMGRTGYGDRTHFSRHFSRQYGLTPSDYRDKNCWML